MTLIAIPLVAATLGLGAAFSGGQPEDGEEGRGFDGIIAHSARQMLREGRQTFRFGTFGAVPPSRSASRRTRAQTPRVARATG